LKANEVIKLLNITRQTLYNYTKQGKIRVTKMDNGHYKYNRDDVYKIFNGGITRKTVIYSRVSTNKQKKDLENQKELLKQFCFTNGIILGGAYSDIASGISFEKRKDFFKMLEEIIEGRIERVVITYKDRLSRVGFDLFSFLFKKYNCEILVISEVANEKLDSQEVFEEIVSLLHCFSMKMYSSRKKKAIKSIFEDKTL